MRSRSALENHGPLGQAEALRKDDFGDAVDGFTSATRVFGVEYLAGVFKHGELVIVSDVHDGFDMSRQVVEVDGGNGFGLAVGLGYAVEQGG